MRLKRGIHWYIVAVLVLYGLSLWPVSRGFIVTLFSPIVTTARHAGEGVASLGALVASIPRLARENAALQARLNELASTDIRNKELSHENELLRKELQLLPDQGKDVIAAQVVSRTASVSQQSIIVNKGSAEGFRVGMGVVAQGYLVGRVGETWEHTSRVILITSAESVIPVVLQNSRSVGLLRGGAEGLVVEDIPRDITVGRSEAIVTSNLGDFLKSGIPIGTVATVISGKSDVFQSVRIHSPIDLSRLEMVFGVK